MEIKSSEKMNGDGKKMVETEFSEEALRKIASQKINFRISVKIHLLIYVIGNFILFLINMWTGGFNLLLFPLTQTHPQLRFTNLFFLWWFWYPLFGKRKINKFKDTDWGKLWESYDQGPKVENYPEIKNWDRY